MRFFPLLIATATASLVVDLRSQAASLRLPAQPQRAQALTVGSKVPDLETTDSNGEALTWGRWPKKPVIVVFHSATMVYSKQGLNDLVAALGAEKALAGKLGLLIVARSQHGLEELSKLGDSSGQSQAVTVDPKREAFGAYRVVAFPTAFCIGSDRKIIHIAKGYGPMFADRIVAAGKYATGLIDKKAFDARLHPSARKRTGAKLLKLARTVRMVRQLIAAGMVDEARESLLKVIDEKTEYADGVALLAKVFLLQSRPADALPWIDRHAKLAPGSVVQHRLRAEYALHDGKPDVAEKELEGLDARDPEIRLLRGRILEARGRFKEAAELYRRALESVVGKEE